MKVNITFDMDEPEDVAKHNLMLRADDMGNALWEIQYNISRKYQKHLNAPEGATWDDAVDAIFEDITAAINSESLNLDELI
jgi:hypothetical protein